MKNIYVLTTNKPSRLVKLRIFNNDKLYLCKEILPIQDEERYQNIYITSDEEIKEGDWVYFISTKEIVKVPNGGFKGKVCKKIILTTDQDLIKEGIQAIDDEFLEWFVKNPSCEEVEINIWNKGYNNPEDFPYQEFYKIIIPKEEPNYNMKQEILAEMERVCNCGLKESEHNVRHPFIPKQTDEKGRPMTYWGGLQEEPKDVVLGNKTSIIAHEFDKLNYASTSHNKETLEEAAEIFVKNRFCKQICGDESYPDMYVSKESIVESHILFAKWQAERMISKEAYEDSLNMQQISNAGYESKINELQGEIKRMYSEEEVLELLHQRLSFTFGGAYEKSTTIKWFEQLKKK